METVREIAMISGRGSSGKESLMAALLALAGRAVTADCTFEYNALVKMLNPRDLREMVLPFFRGFHFDTDHCTHCGMCLGICMQHALEIRDNRMVFHEYRCMHCGSCIKWCPMMALNHEEQSDVSLYSAEGRFGPLVFTHAFLEPSLQTRMIGHIRQHARTIARDRGIPYIFTNSSRGLRLTTYKTVADADLLIALISPGPYATDDLERMIRFCRQSGKEPWVVINMSDLEPGPVGMMKDMAERLGALVAAEIPYDTEFHAALQENMPITVYQPESNVVKTINGMWEKIQEHLKLL